MEACVAEVSESLNLRSPGGVQCAQLAILHTKHTHTSVDVNVNDNVKSKFI